MSSKIGDTDFQCDRINKLIKKHPESENELEILRTAISEQRKWGRLVYENRILEPFGTKTYELIVDPNTKPRMTRSDKWKKRKCVVQYYGYKDIVKSEARRLKMPELPTILQSTIFVVPIPKSWSKKKKISLDGKLHTQRPDLDNYLKGLWDALCKEDSHIAKINGPLEKRWGKEGKIIISFQ